MSEVNYKEVELFSYMSSQAYMPDGGIAPEGWQIVADSAALGMGGNTGYYGVAYQNTEHPDQIVIAHRGTEFDKDTWKDAGVADRQIIFEHAPDQYRDARQFAEAISERMHVPLDAFEHTGHSLGGNIASLLSIATDAHSTVFNAPGQGEQLAEFEALNDVAPGTYQNADYSGQVTAYQLAGDVVGSFGTQKGTTIMVDNPSLAAQMEEQQTLRDNIDIAKGISPGDIRPNPFLELQAFRQAAEAAEQNHSIQYFHAVAQDHTAQSRMDATLEPPEAPDAIPTKAEWAAGDGFQELQEAPVQPPPTEDITPPAEDITSPPDAFAPPATQNLLPDAFTSAAIIDDPAQTASTLPDAFAVAAPVSDAPNQTPTTSDASAAAYDAFAGLQTAPAADISTPTPPDAFTPATNITLPDAFVQNVVQPPPPDAFVALQPPSDPPQTSTFFDNPNPVSAGDPFAAPPPATPVQQDVFIQPAEDSSRHWASSFDNPHSTPLESSQGGWTSQIVSSSSPSSDTGHSSWADHTTHHDSGRSHGPTHTSWVDNVSHQHTPQHDVGNHDTGPSHGHGSNSPDSGHSGHSHDSSGAGAAK